MEVEEMVRNKGARLASLVAVGVLAFGALAACGDDGDSNDSGDSGSSGATTEGKIGVILPDTTTSPGRPTTGPAWRPPSRRPASTTTSRTPRATQPSSVSCATA
jgi:hypothetical protein